MPVWQAVILGVVQGLAEFLPISSSAHLILVPWLFGWEDPGVAFDVALHWGTLVAVLAVFWRDWIKLVAAGLISLRDRRFWDDPDKRLFWGLVIATIPGAIIGKLLDKLAEEHLRSPALIAGTMAVMGALLWVADRVGKKDRELHRVSPGEAAAIGFAQAAALIPGVSRSGATITTGLFFGLDRESIARFSFLMSTPIIFGAGLLKFPKLIHALRHGPPPGEPFVSGAALAAGFITAAIVGTIAVRWMLAWLRGHTYGAFAIYRGLVAVFIVVMLVVRG